MDLLRIWFGPSSRNRATPAPSLADKLDCEISRFLGRFARSARFVTSRQPFVRCCQHCVGWAAGHHATSANSPACKGKSLRCLRKCRFIDTSPALSARRDLTARFALFSFSAPSTAAFSSHLGCQTHQTYYFTHLQSRPRRGSPVAHTRFKTLIYLKGFGVGPCRDWFQRANFWRR